MAMEKGLYAAPQGISALADQPDMEIEIEDPESVHIGMGDIEIDLQPQKKQTGEDFDANLADYIDDKELATLGMDLIGDFDKDLGDRKEWIKTGD